MKRPKEEVKYGPGHKLNHCGKQTQFDTGYCRFFHSNTVGKGGIRQGSCEKVAGPILPGMWCKLWEKAR